MFCYQCEEAAHGKGCTKIGVCGKNEATSNGLDELIQIAKGISMYAHRAALRSAQDVNIDAFVLDALFTSVTNVNFDAERIQRTVQQGVTVRKQAQALYVTACKKAGDTPEVLAGPATWQPNTQDVGVEDKQARLGETVAGLQELVLYGLKGMAAYACHARILGKENQSINAFFHEILDRLAEEPTAIDELLAMVLRVGEVNLQVMELLDQANTGTFGHPEPTSVRVTPVAGKAILVSGHDLKDLKDLLEQTKDKNINVYTHSEMLPANAYPELKKYPHLIGNYGGAWYDQNKEFSEFPGAIVMTTNCIQKPLVEYKNRIFTNTLVGWPGVTQLENNDFTPAIEAALATTGFAEDAEEKRQMIGFGHNAVLGVADKVVEAVKAGQIKHFYLIGGCDGRKTARNYYAEAAKLVPDDSVILTLACGKFRINQAEYGDIGGIPRLLDIGQCNDAYSAIKIAGALAEAFETDVNGLPLSFLLSWYEQKAVVILLTLLHLGIKNIHLGPSLPAFVTTDVLNVLVEKFSIKPTGNAAEDIEKITGSQSCDPELDKTCV
jgi:hydroxylamine reductase